MSIEALIFFADFIENEFKVAMNIKIERSKRLNLLQAIHTQLLVVYGIKVEGVQETPSKIVELLDVIDSQLNFEM